MNNKLMIFMIFAVVALCVSYTLDKRMSECVKKDEIFYRFAVKAAENLSFGYRPIEELTSVTEKECLEATNDVCLKRYLDKYSVSDLSDLRVETDNLVAYADEKLKKAQLKYEKEKPLLVLCPIALQLLVGILIC